MIGIIGNYFLNTLFLSIDELAWLKITPSFEYGHISKNSQTKNKAIKKEMVQIRGGKKEKALFHQTCWNLPVYGSG